MTMRAVSRRDFLRVGGGAGAGLLFIGQVGGRLFEVPVEAAQDPVGLLDPASVPKYLTPLLIPPVMPRAGTVTMKGGKGVDYYEISMRQFVQQVLPTGLPATTVWGYGGKAAQSWPAGPSAGPPLAVGCRYEHRRPSAQPRGCR